MTYRDFDIKNSIWESFYYCIYAKLKLTHK